MIDAMTGLQRSRVVLLTGAVIMAAVWGLVKFIEKRPRDKS